MRRYWQGQSLNEIWVTRLNAFYAQARTLRFADGPDEVHRNQIARLELSGHRPASK